MSSPVSQQPQPIPESARARLARSTAGKPFFTSDLSVNEFVLTTQTVRSTALIRHSIGVQKTGHLFR